MSPVRELPGIPAAPAKAGGSSTLVGLRFAFTVASFHDRLLRCATREVFGELCWRYRPGWVWRDELRTLAAELGHAPRTGRLARQQLLARNYIREVPGGIIVPAIELMLEPAERADPRGELGSQLELPFLATAPDRVWRYLETAEPAVVMRLRQAAAGG